MWCQEAHCQRFLLGILQFQVLTFFNPFWVSFWVWCNMFPNTTYWRDCPFLIVFFWLLCHKLTVYVLVYFWALSWWSKCLFLCQFHTVLITVALLYSLKLESMMPPALLSLKVALVVQGLLWFHTDLRIVSPISMKNAIGILIGIALHLYICLGSMDILTFF